MAAAAVPIIIGVASTVGSALISRAMEPDTDVPDAGPDPGQPLTADEAAMRRRLQIRRNRESLVVNAPGAQPPSTGLQIPT